MALAQKDIEQIRHLIREEVEARPAPGLVRDDLELRERIVRVEEELRHQRELMEPGFRLKEERFEQADARFGSVERGLEPLAERLDRFMRWSFGITLTVGGLVVAAIKYLP